MNPSLLKNYKIKTYKATVSPTLGNRQHKPMMFERREAQGKPPPPPFASVFCAGALSHYGTGKWSSRGNSLAWLGRRRSEHEATDKAGINSVE